MENARLRAVGAIWAALAFAGCGSQAAEHSSTAWDRVRSCLADRGIEKVDGIPPSGPYAPPDVMPLDFGDAPGGWLIADMARGQRLGLFFYADAADAARAEEDAASADTRPFGTMGNVIYVFDEEPTSEEHALLDACLGADAGAPRTDTA